MSPTQKNPQTETVADTLLAVAHTDGVPTEAIIATDDGAVVTLTTPPENEQPDALAPRTVDEALTALLALLDVDQRDLLSLEVRRNGIIRIAGIDRSVSTVRFTALEDHKRDRDNRIIR